MSNATDHNGARAALTRADLFAEAVEAFTLATLELRAARQNGEAAPMVARFEAQHATARADLVQAALALPRATLTRIT